MEIKETGIKEVDEVLSSINSEPSFDQIVAYQRLANMAAVAIRRADDAEKWKSLLEYWDCCDYSMGLLEESDIV